MFQTFEPTTSPDQGPPRLAALRSQMVRLGIDAFIVPRADAHQGEYVAPRDERLSWLTGFTGSAGFAIVTADTAAVFVDGRYRVQVKAQVADLFTPVDWPATKPGTWLVEQLQNGAKVGFDPWLHTTSEIEKLEKALAEKSITLVPVENPVDAVWPDQPDRPAAPVTKYPKELAGDGDETKRNRIAATLNDAGQKSGVLTLPDSLCWLLNIRGADIPRNPVVHAFAILHSDGTLDLFSDPAKFADLGPDPAITLTDWKGFLPKLKTLTGPVRVDASSAPWIVGQTLDSAGIEIVWQSDPCALAKACKSNAEIAATREAHLRDGAAMVNFLHWLDGQADQVAAGDRVTETDVVRALEGFRRATNQLQDISFETIAGAGPNGAIVHYRVTDQTDRALELGELLLVDSGGQYLDGTTDITRTIPIGAPDADQIAAFTRVLKGMIAISRARFPKGLAGRDLDALARAPLWMAGQDYDHGTGHGVGVYLSVHEGPQRISRISEIPLRPGMILSNEPGYYREGAWGIRIENLIVVEDFAIPRGGDGHREMLGFETLTFAPIDRRLIDVAALSPGERDWLDRYHADVAAKIGDRVEGPAAVWLKAATAPL